MTARMLIDFKRRVCRCGEAFAVRPDDPQRECTRCRAATRSRAARVERRAQLAAAGRCVKCDEQLAHSDPRGLCGWCIEERALETNEAPAVTGASAHNRKAPA